MHFGRHRRNSLDVQLSFFYATSILAREKRKGQLKSMPYSELEWGVLLATAPTNSQIKDKAETTKTERMVLRNKREGNNARSLGKKGTGGRKERKEKKTFLSAETTTKRAGFCNALFTNWPPALSFKIRGETTLTGCTLRRNEGV